MAVKTYRARKVEIVHSNVTRQGKEDAKAIDQEARLKETIQQNDNLPEKQGKVNLEKNIVLRVSTSKKKEVVVMIESVIIGIFAHCRNFETENVKRERIVHSHTHKRRIGLPVQKNKVKENCPNKRKKRLQL